MIATTGAGNFERVFDLGTAGYRLWVMPAYGLLGVALAGVLWWAMRRGILKADAATRKLVMRFVLGFSIFWMVTQLAFTLPDYLSCRKALAEGRVEYAEGEVTNYQAVATRLKATESFAVAGHVFKYSDETMIPGFHQTMAAGGPIREGEDVRVWFLKNDILRLDIRR